jgi:hypothetical protein
MFAIPYQHQSDIVGATRDPHLLSAPVIKVVSELTWFWIAIEPIDKEIISITVSKERQICL